MKISIISDEHFPHTGADTEVIVNTAAALGDLGAEVTLLTPWLWHHQVSPDALYEYYGVKSSFTHHALFNPCPPERLLRSQQFTHAFLCATQSSFWKADIIHSRNHAPITLAHFFKRPWSYETYRRHAAEKPWLPKWTKRINFKRVIGAISHSEQSAKDLQQLGFNEESVLVARPGFNRTAFTQCTSRDIARKKLGISSNQVLVGYVGNIGPGKGVNHCIKAMKEIHHAQLLIVGGSTAEVASLTNQIPNEQRDRVHLTGHQPSARVPLYISACDLVLIPPLERNSRGAILDRILPKILPGTPLKIYAYWAAQRPIIAADQPHSSEILMHEKNALLYDSDSSESFRQTIERALSDKALAQAIAHQGHQEVQIMTYTRRAEQMLAFYERRLSEIGQIQ